VFVLEVILEEFQIDYDDEDEDEHENEEEHDWSGIGLVS
jgi:hypothetical protein